jgi:hypothetical protein
MAGLLSRGSSWLSSRLQAEAVQVTYRRGNDSIDALAVVPGNTRHDELGAEAANVTSRDRDWIVLAADLVIGGQRVEPERGDEIDWIDATGIMRTFCVLERPGDRCFRYTDQTMQRVRIYTVDKLASSE